ncbi:epsin-3 [Coprinopsis sp. MPI-PUGE-AT-0042]|nr:epsin-3 [Coprinopsis sp. MPI-PUGE-AT-0042]
MDKIESLSSTLSNITMYDIKSMYNQAKNVVLNVSETEAKVREATNDDPWGASSTLMSEIAQGAQFNEIMPCIYGRFMEKEARQWRQIYKALQLLEYLVKNGSERVVDDARSHISTLKMLRNFHYIDDKGKDEGINVRNRAKELVELLSDVEKIRGERRKAKANKSKFTGVGNDGMGFGGGGGGSRYGGFGSDSLEGGGGGGSSWNDHYSNPASHYGGSSGAGRSGYNDNSSSRRQYEEYDAGGDEVRSGSSSSSRSANPTRTSSAVKKTAAPAPAPAPAPAAPAVSLLDLDDDFGPPAAAPPVPSTNKALPAVSLDAPVAAAAQPALAPSPAAAAAAKPNLMDLLNQQRPSSTPLTAQPFAQPAAFGSPLSGHRPNPSLSGQQSLFGGAPVAQAQSQPMFGGVQPMAPSSMSSFGASAARPGSTPAISTPAAKPANSANFDDLWNLSLGTTSKPANASTGGAKSIQALQKEKAMANIWGSGGAQKPAGSSNAGASSGGNDDLLL